MSVFGMYFTANMLRTMNWPRRTSVIKKAYIDTMIFDSTVDQMIDWAASIGSGYPKLALRLIYCVYFDADWSIENAPDIRNFIESTRESSQDSVKSPHDVIGSSNFKELFGKKLADFVLDNEKTRIVLEQKFVYGLLYGLGNSERFETWYESLLKDYEHNKNAYVEAGLMSNNENLPNLKENYEHSLDIVSAYQADINKLPIFSEIPEKLLSDAKSLGVI